MIKIGVIGYGYWGPNLVRNFFENNSFEIKTVVDLSTDRLANLKKHYPSICTTTDHNDIFKDKEIDAVIIATPISTHYKLTKKALDCDKHVLVEKPLAHSYKEAIELVELARKRKKILMVDHTFLYTDAVQKIKSLIDKGEIGKVNYFDSTRTNLGLFQTDANVIWDLAAHDVSILTYLISEKPESIQASGVSHTKNGIENISFITVKYSSGLLAHFNSSWSSPVKIRRILIGATKKMIVYDDIEPTEKIKVYDSGYKFINDNDKKRISIDYRIGDIYIPKVELKEALSNLAADFLKAINTEHKPISSGTLGLQVVKILSLADQSMKKGGKPMKYFL
jgi:predicted dehydrogenase